MTARKTRVVSMGMEQARRRLARWRETRTPGAPIPDSLWADAVRLTRRHGVHRTARVLGLEYNKLNRLSQATGHPQKAPPSPAFMELITAQPADVRACRIELEGPHGGTMKIELPIASAELVVGLCRVVWGGAA